MKNHTHCPFTRILNNQKGVSAILVAILLPVLIGFAALAIDVGYLYTTKNELQNVADAAALAGASELGRIYLELPGTQHKDYELNPVDEDRIKEAAKLVAIKNAAARKFIEIIDEDIYIGHWDFEETDPQQRFKNNQDPPIAVRVDAKRDSILNNNPVNTFFAIIFGVDTFKSSARATASLSGASSVDEDILTTPFAISEINDCGDFISFSPTPSSCAGWHNYFDHPASANFIENKMYGFIENHLEGPEWMDTHAGNASGTATTAPAVEVGDSFYFTGGKISSFFTGYYYPNWSDKDNHTTEVEGQGNSYAPFFALFDFFRFRDNDHIDTDGNPVTSIVACGSTYEPDEVWTTAVPIYEESGDCGNPSQDNKIIGFAPVRIIMAGQPPDTTIEVCLSCDMILEPGRGGGSNVGTIFGSIPSLVE